MGREPQRMDGADRRVGQHLRHCSAAQAVPQLCGGIDEDLLSAVDSLRRHMPFLTSTVTDFVLGDYVRRGDAAPEDSAPGVTAREREIIQLVAEGLSSKAAAATLGISVKTVEAHRASIMKKLHFRSVSDLVRYALRNNIVQL